MARDVFTLGLSYHPASVVAPALIEAWLDADDGLPPEVCPGCGFLMRWGIPDWHYPPVGAGPRGWRAAPCSWSQVRLLGRHYARLAIEFAASGDNYRVDPELRARCEEHLEVTPGPSTLVDERTTGRAAG